MSGKDAKVIQKRMKSGKSQIRELQQSNECVELSGTDGGPWKNFPGFTTIDILRKTQKDLEARQRNPE